jgi:hypothetical protein
MLRAAGGRGESKQASITADCMLVDEVEDWPDMHRLELITQRLSQSPDPLAIYTSTVKRDTGSLILALYDEGTRTRVEVPCPTCGAFQLLEWEQVDVAAETYRCVHCPAAWSEHDRRQALKHWRRKDLTPGAAIFSIRWTSLDSPFALNTPAGKMPTLPALCLLYRRALEARERGDHSMLRSFERDRLARGYVGDAQGTDTAIELTVESLLARSAGCVWGPTVPDTDREGEERSYSRHLAPLPPPALRPETDARRPSAWSVVVIDVQGDRCYWLQMVGTIRDMTFDQAWGYEHFDRRREEMTEAQLHAVLDRIDGFTRGLTGDLAIVGRGVDANYNTDAVLKWLRTHEEWWPVYGASARKAARMQKSGRRIKDYPGICYLRRPEKASEWTLRQDRCHIDTDPMRHAAQRAYLLQPGTDGAAHLPRGLENTATDRNYPEHLTAEVWDPQTLAWKKPKGAGRHDYLDLRTYGTALHRLHLLKMITPVAEVVPDAPSAGSWLNDYRDTNGPWVNG